MRRRKRGQEKGKEEQEEDQDGDDDEEGNRSLLSLRHDAWDDPFNRSNQFDCFALVTRQQRKNRVSDL